jgi:hypothetical protein
MRYKFNNEAAFAKKHRRSSPNAAALSHRLAMPGDDGGVCGDTVRNQGPIGLRVWNARRIA